MGKKRTGKTGPIQLDGENKPLYIRTRFLFSVLGIVIFQVLLTLLLIYSTGVFRDTAETSVNVFKNEVDSKALSLEEALERWANPSLIMGRMETITSEIESLYGQPAGSMQENSAIREAYLKESLSALVTLLKGTGRAGAFLFLQGDGTSAAKEGIYIKADNPQGETKENSEITAWVGSAKLMEELGIKTGKYWQETKTMTAQDAFFWTPMETLQKNVQLEPEETGYWSGPFYLLSEDDPVIAFSMPLEDEKGNVFGVVGVTVNVSCMESLLNSGTTDLIALKDLSFGNFFKNGASVSFESLLNEGDQTSLSLQVDGNYEGVFRTAGVKSAKPFVYASAISLYEDSSPYEGNNWVLLGIAEQKEIYQDALKLFFTLLFSFLVTMVISSILAFMEIRRLVAPVQGIVQELAAYDPDSLKLTRSNIVELDRLMDAIEGMNKSVLDSSTKLTHVIGAIKMRIAIVEYDRNSTRVYCTDTLFSILDESIEGYNNHYVSREAFDKFKERVAIKLEQDREESNRFYFIDKNKKKRWLYIECEVTQGRVLCVLQDVTRDMRERIKIQRERDYDVLTDQLNRRAFANRMEIILKQNKDIQGVFSIWDLDNLKYYNDTYGHDMGDKYIRLLANVLGRLQGEQGLVGRMAGDEFTVFLYGYENYSYYVSLLKSVHSEFLSEKIDLPDGKKMEVSVSAGMSLYPRDGANFDELISFADFAMYEVKNAHKGDIRLFNADTYKRNSVILRGTGELARIIREQSIQYMFQPIIDVHSGEIYAYEALMRPVSDILTNPEVLIRVAQHNSKLNMIEKLTWFRALESFFKQNPSPSLKLFLNSIPNQFLTEDNVFILEQIYGNRLRRLVMEITENIKVNAAIEKKKRAWCDKWNIAVALDDYGAGYSNNDKLVNLDLNFVKLDRSLVRSIDRNESKKKLVEGIIEYCHQRGILVIAEGVELREELTTVMELGTDYVQGFYFAFPQYQCGPVVQERLDITLEIQEKIQASRQKYLE